MTEKLPGLCKRILAGGLLIAIAVAHGKIAPWFTLDWPAAILVMVGVAILFLPELTAGLPYVKRVRWGDKEIELRARLLDAEVEQLIQHSKGEAGAQVTSGWSADAIRDSGLESKIVDLAAKDKGAALVKLAIELETELLRLHQDIGLKLKKATWREMVQDLVERGMLSDAFGKAIIDFRDVRNRVIHSGFGGPVQDSLLTSTLDTGLKLLRELKAMRPKARSAQ